MDKTDATDFWNLVDGVLVINLDERTDRWERFVEQVKPHFDLAKVHRVSATLGTGVAGYGKPPLFQGHRRDKTWAARGGCTLSHRDAITQAKQAGWRTVLILEDDIELTPDFTSQLPALASALQNKFWDICYLGYTDPVSPYRLVAPLDSGFSLQQVYGCSTTHAYLLAVHTYDWLLAELPTAEHLWIWLTRHRAIDRWYKRNLSKRFEVTVVSPSLINQHDGYSDIVCRDAASAKAHLTQVPDKACGRYLYAFARAARRLLFAVDGLWDYLRGLYKRCNGF